MASGSVSSMSGLVPVECESLVEVGSSARAEPEGCTACQVGAVCVVSQGAPVVSS